MTQTQDPIQLDQQAVVNPQVPLDSQQVPGIQPEVVASPEVVVPNAAVPVQPSVSPGAVAPDQGFLDSMITKGVQGIASLTGSPDPQTWSASAVQEKGMFGGFFDGAKNIFGKAVSATANIAGKTLQTWAQVVGGVTQTAVQTGSTLAQWVGNAVQNNQGWDMLQNVMGAVSEVAKTTVQAGTQVVGGAVEAGKQTMSGVVEVGKDAAGTVASEIPFGGNIIQQAVNTVGDVADKAVNITGSVADKAVNVGTGVVNTAEYFWSAAMEKVEQVAHSATDTISTVGSSVANQASGIIQDIQKGGEGVQEGEVQQPMYVNVPEAPVAAEPAPVAPENVAQ